MNIQALEEAPEGLPLAKPIWKKHVLSSKALKEAPEGLPSAKPIWKNMCFLQKLWKRPLKACLRPNPFGKMETVKVFVINHLRAKKRFQQHV